MVDTSFVVSNLSSETQMENEKPPVLVSREKRQIEMPATSEKPDSHPPTPQFSCNPCCAFMRRENSMLASKGQARAAKKLCVLIVFYLIVIIVEIVGGLRANSLAIITDAAHLISDVAGFSVSLFAVWASGWEATPRQSFGYNRLEVLGALVSVQLIWLISGLLIYEALGRMLHKSVKVNGLLMFAIAAVGFTVNLVMVIWLGHNHHHPHDHGHAKEEVTNMTTEEKLHLCSSTPGNISTSNLNLEGAHLHVITDLIQSIGVMIAGAIIWARPDWLVVDLLCTFVFSILSLSTTKPMLKSIYGILMEGTPPEICITSLENGLKRIHGVLDIHDLHVWSITTGKIVLSCHAFADPCITSRDVIHRIKDYCEKVHEIRHVTIQIE